MSEIYLGLAAVLIFSACFIAAKKNRLPLKQNKFSCSRCLQLSPLQ
jgi:hypothetical protein